jgi:hypothetical protein
MEAIELRIGNWYDDNGVARQVTPSVIQEVFEAQRIWCERIQISEKWIDKINEKEFDFCGFGTRIIYQSIKFPALKYEFSGQMIFVYFNEECINAKKFVHQWQNIHFSLTNEELDLNN